MKLLLSHFSFHFLLDVRLKYKLQIIHYEGKQTIFHNILGNPPNSLNIMKLPKNMAKIGHNLYFSLQATIIIFISKQNEGMHVF